MMSYVILRGDEVERLHAGRIAEEVNGQVNAEVVCITFTRHVQSAIENGADLIQWTKDFDADDNEGKNMIPLRQAGYEAYKELVENCEILERHYKI